MTDRPDPLADTVELASRYVDGDLDTAERAAAEADAEVMAWVDRLSEVRAALREPVAIDPTTRDAALAAALAAAETGTPTPPAVDELAAVRARRSKRLGTWLGGVAAAAVLAVGGFAVAGNLGGSTADDASEPHTVAMSAEATTPASGEQESASVFADDRAADDQAADAGGDGTAEPSAAAPSAEAPTTAAGTDTTAAPASTTAPADRNRQLDRAALRELATAPPVTGRDARAVPCASEAAGAELVAADVVVDDQAAVVYRDEVARTVTAYAVADCTILVTESYG